MKTSLIFLSLLALGAAGCRQKPSSAPATVPPDATAQESANTGTVPATPPAPSAPSAVATAKDAITQHLVEWKLTPADIRADLAASGRIVRKKAEAVGGKIGATVDNARIVTVINSKYFTDSKLSALKINVDADHGVVTLNGTVASPELLGRAVVLALDTDGVHEVDSLLRVESVD